jgi:hypothetical protein
MEPRDLYMIGKSYATELHSQILFAKIFGLWLIESAGAEPMDIKGLIYYFHRSKTSVVFKVGELH